MRRTGRNQGAYHGERVDIDAVLREMFVSAHLNGWTVHHLSAGPGIALPVLYRPPSLDAAWHPRLYLSTGIHGDEPAGPLAMAELIRRDLLPRDAWLWCCPCLNPTGFAQGTRTSASGVDLNRDYRHLRTPEVRAHVAWLDQLPTFDVAFCLHEDWEAAGFYVYELNPLHRPTLAPAILEGAAEVCPIEMATMIDGREATAGLIRPNIEPSQRPEWPEALYLIQTRTRLSYTLEAPSDFEMRPRVAALVEGTHAAVDALRRSPPPPGDAV